MKYHQMRLDEAYYYVKKKRDCICPSDGLWQQLIDFDKKLFQDKEEKDFKDIRE